MVAGLPATLAEPVQKQVRRTLEVAAGGKGPTVDGKLEDWPSAETAWARIDPRTTASLWITAERIHAAFRTGDPKLLDNSATDPRYLFKFGGALDLYFGAKWNPGNLQENKPYQTGRLPPAHCEDQRQTHRRALPPRRSAGTEERGVRL